MLKEAYLLLKDRFFDMMEYSLLVKEYVKAIRFL